MQVSIEFLESDKNGWFLDFDSSEIGLRNKKADLLDIWLQRQKRFIFPKSSVLWVLMKFFRGSNEMRKCTPVVRLQRQGIVYKTSEWFYR